WINNQQNRFRIPRKNLSQTAELILDALGSPDAELSVVILGAQEMTALNRQYLERDYPANVMAFPMREGPDADLNPGLLGDVVICADTAKKEAEAAKVPFSHRLRELLIHGTLHLMGHDHAEPGETARMEAEEARLLALAKEAGKSRKANADFAD
ncbi:MAG: rRNA maturation RNase YbeY, partial [Pseudomonadota bacterium]